MSNNFNGKVISKRSFEQAFPKIKEEPGVSIPTNELSVESPEASFIINFLDQEEETTSNDSEPEEFSCTILAFERQFKGQSSGRNVARWTVSATNPEQFIANIWKLSKPFLKREIIFRTNPDGSTYPAWGSLPELADFGRFAIFQSNRRHYSIDNVLERKVILRCWTAKEISLYLHNYSTSIGSKAVWLTVKPVLIDPVERVASGNGFSIGPAKSADMNGLQIANNSCNNSYDEGIRGLRLSLQRTRAILEGLLASFDEMDTRIARLEKQSLTGKSEP